MASSMSPDDLVAHAVRRRGAVDIGDYDVPDPIGQSAEVHREVADLLDRGCTATTRALAATLVERWPKHAFRDLTTGRLRPDDGRVRHLETSVSRAGREVAPSPAAHAHGADGPRC